MEQEVTIKSRSILDETQGLIVRSLECLVCIILSTDYSNASAFLWTKVHLIPVLWGGEVTAFVYEIKNYYRQNCAADHSNALYCFMQTWLELKYT